MTHDARKSVFGVSDNTRLKPTCSVTELKVFLFASLSITLSREQTKRHWPYCLDVQAGQRHFVRLLLYQVFPWHGPLRRFKQSHLGLVYWWCARSVIGNCINKLMHDWLKSEVRAKKLAKTRKKRDMAESILGQKSGPTAMANGGGALFFLLCLSIHQLLWS